MSNRRFLCILMFAATLATWCVAPAAPAAGAGGTIDPSDPRLVPDPIASSDEGTAWSCRTTGPEVRCDGSLLNSWTLVDGPVDWCAVPLYSINGTFTRDQSRNYAYDPASGQYLEYKRLVHLGSDESLTPVPDPGSTNVVIARLNMTWFITFQTPGDLDSRVARKQGIDTFFKPANGGLVVLDVGQKTTVLGDDLDFKGRWDIALGDPAVEFGKVCSALGL